jgi:hypothetical protein
MSKFAFPTPIPNGFLGYAQKSTGLLSAPQMLRTGNEGWRANIFALCAACNFRNDYDLRLHLSPFAGRPGRRAIPPAGDSECYSSMSAGSARQLLARALPRSPKTRVREQEGCLESE